MYGDSHALSSDSCSIFPSNFKLREGVASVNRGQQFVIMESDANNNYSSEFRHQLIGCNNSSHNSSGLLRFRSAPTSLLSSFTSGGEKSESFGSRFCSDEVNSMHVVSENDESKGRFTAMNSQLPPQYPRQVGAQLGYGFDQQGQQGRVGLSPSRQNSSPAGLFSHHTSQNGYSGMRGIGSYSSGELSPTSSRFNFSSGVPSSLGMLSRINENSGLQEDEGKVGTSSGDSLFFTTCGFPFGSWNDSSYFAENFIKREVADSDIPNQTYVDQKSCEVGNRPNMLSHHLSLPKTSAEMAAMEKLLQLQETVPCKVRAKRGCATHPRSIAERVRRTRISERMRKLQDLVPNMEKQTNTADMLDLAVDYIKGLQKQYKTLSDCRANCRCSAFQKVVSDRTH